MSQELNDILEADEIILEWSTLDRLEYDLDIHEALDEVNDYLYTEHGIKQTWQRNIVDDYEGYKTGCIDDDLMWQAEWEEEDEEWVFSIITEEEYNERWGYE